MDAPVLALEDPVLALDEPVVALDEPVDDTFAEEDERVFAVEVAPETLDDAPLPIGLPMTFTLGSETADDCEPDELTAVELEPDVEVWA
ncbi:MAG: hypothetical protein P4L71_06305 [Acetobacteraceae bacterium]|nr:hypothetical protein [Acetobacteraceae bacterium]